MSLDKLDAAIDAATPQDSLDLAIEGVAKEADDERRRSLLGVSGRSPEEFAEAKKIGKVLSLPTAAVANNLPELKKRSRMAEIDAAIDGAPVLARELQRPDFAGVAQDEVESLKDVESTFGTLRNPQKAQTFFEALWSAIPSSKDGRVHYSAGNRAAQRMARDQQPLTDQPEQAGALRFNRETGRLERQGDVFSFASEVAGAFGHLPANTLATMEAVFASDAGSVTTSPYLREQLARKKSEDTGVDTTYPYKLKTAASGVESLPFSLFSTVAYLSASIPIGAATKSPVAAHTAGMASSFAFAYRADRGQLWNELYPVANAAFRLHTGLQRDMLPEEFTVVMTVFPAIGALIDPASTVVKIFVTNCAAGLSAVESYGASV